MMIRHKIVNDPKLKTRRLACGAPLESSRAVGSWAYVNCPACKPLKKKRRKNAIPKA